MASIKKTSKRVAFMKKNGKTLNKNVVCKIIRISLKTVNITILYVAAWSMLMQANPTIANTEVNVCINRQFMVLK